MDLKRFSLGKEKETKSNTIITHNKEPIKGKKIFPHTLEPPTLRLDTDYGSTLYLKLCESSNKALCFEANLKYREDGSSNKTDHIGYSANIFPTFINGLDSLSSKLDDVALEFYFNFVIYGRICESICKSGFQMEAIEIDKDFLNDFVNKSLEFYGYQEHKFKYTFANAMTKIEVQNYNDFILNNSIDCNREFNIGYGKAILGYTEKYVYLRVDNDTVITIVNVNVLAIRNLVKETSSSISEVLAWMLLTSKGYYACNQKFVNPRFYSAEDLSDSMCRKVEITPNNFAQCFKQS